MKDVKKYNKKLYTFLEEKRKTNKKNRTLQKNWCRFFHTL